MKKLLKQFVAKGLLVLARAIIKKYQPTIVMVTGSVGKTSTKDACAAALSTRFFLRASEKSYNSEFGVPLTIIGTPNPWNNPLQWLQVFEEAFSLLLFKERYPELLILEVGADAPGDLAHILKIATPDAVVVTRLPEVPVHVEAYADPSAVREEEFSPARKLSAGAPLIVCADDAYAVELAQTTSAAITTYGVSNADVRIQEDTIVASSLMKYGMSAVLATHEGNYPIFVENALGTPQLSAVAAAFTLARALGSTPDLILKGLESYTPPKGRLRMFAGLNNSILVDDTYNASPIATEEALKAISRIPGTHRSIVLLGDMLELGKYSVEEHEKIGARIGRQADILLCVGVRAHSVASSALAAGMKEENVYVLENATEAGELAATLIETGDVVLVKGSQSIRMERASKLLLATPSDSNNLVRQEKEWLAK